MDEIVENVLNLNEGGVVQVNGTMYDVRDVSGADEGFEVKIQTQTETSAPKNKRLVIEPENDIRIIAREDQDNIYAEDDIKSMEIPS